MKKHYRTENDCLNCGAVLEGKYCHNCGQENLQVKESFGHMMNHAISDYFHFDHQFFHTLRPLFLSPGKLTNEYMAGRRVQYLHPVKMYIFISLVYFLLVFQQNNTDNKVEQKKITAEKIQDSVKKSVIKEINADSTISPNLKNDIIKKTFSGGDIYKGHHVTVHVGLPVKKATSDNDDDDGIASIGSDTKYTSYDQYLADQKKLPVDKRDSWFTRFFKKKEIAYHNAGGHGNEIIKEGIKHNFPKMMFLLLPLFALILRIAFWKNKKFYVEHLIYSFHVHCFVFLFLTFIMVIKMVIPHNWETVDDWLTFFAWIAIIWYIYRSLRVVYQRSRWRTLSKMFGMSLSYTLVFSICVTLLVIITAVTAI